jgi:alkanesulfonate monooxygenase SsuD/methylene tetrahydromethanopterin reductase-like flavin-dependent oxidoreductase (luciferase family)
MGWAPPPTDEEHTVTRLRFGTFLAPFHAPGQNPTLAMQRDLRLIEHLDALGYDEAWIGEHHSAGSEIIASPEIFIAAAAERTRNIKLGTGVTSIAYHNPLWVADRMVMLDHLTRGRTMLGVGPGSLPTDSAMIGLNPTDTRELLDVNLDIIVRLLRGEVVTQETRTHRLVDAQLQLRPYTDPCFDIAVAAVASPTGPRLAGKYGAGLLSIGATLTPDGFDALAVGDSADVKGMIDFINEAGVGAIGTVDDARRQVQRLVDQSNGGFGAMLLLSHDWANPEATRRSFELIAQNVFPEFQGQAAGTLAAAERARVSREAHAATQLQAVDHMTAKYQREKAGEA